jgi:hypothetical protein
MSVSLSVELASLDIPTAADVIAIASAYGGRLSFPDGFDPTSDSGFVPCALNGESAGFEYIFETPTETDSPKIKLFFETRSSYASYAAAALVAGAMVILSNGYLLDEDGVSLNPESIPAWLKTIELPEPGADEEFLRVPVTVVGPRGNNLLQLKLGKVRAGTHLMRRMVESIPVEKVPPKLRNPNARFTIVVRDAHEIIGVEPIETGAEHSEA